MLARTFAHLGIAGLLYFTAMDAAHAIVSLDDLQSPLRSVDARAGSLPPLAEAATLLAAHPEWQASWTRFGTVRVLQRRGGYLATGLGSDPESAVRAWLKNHRSLFRLSEASVDALQLVRSEPLNQSQAQVLLFRQTANSVPVAWEGRIKVGVVNGSLFWIASSSIGDPGNVATPTLTAAQAWTAAANQVMPRINVAVPALTALPDQGEWKMFNAPGFTGAQRVRRGVIGRPGLGAVPVFEANVVRNDVLTGRMIGYTAYVDGLSGNTLVLQNRVEQLHDAEDATRATASHHASASADKTEVFDGDYKSTPTGGTCHGPYAVSATDGYVRLVALANATVPANDISIDIYFGDSTCASSSLAHADTATSPELATYAPTSGVVPPGNYYVQVHDFSTAVPITTYNGTFTYSGAATPQPTSANAQWRHFRVNPGLDYADTDRREQGCWFGTNPDGTALAQCVDEYVEGSSHRIAWDYAGSAPSMTTRGNNATTVEGWNAAIGGGSAYQPAPRADRNYSFPWANTWFKNACSPTVINHALPEANDIDAAITNLNAFHNRLHDFAYQLGLRERTGVAQFSNYGQTEAARENDAETGIAQAGAIDGGFPAYLGRDNANQMTLQDGVSPISNMYLWQTIGGAAYAPCVDGDFDAQVFAHEYGHLVQGRMTDPDQGLSGQQGRSMGEGWSDMNALMFMDEFGLAPDNAPDKYALGSYISGDLEKGIRNYAMNRNPLNLSNIGYDVSCEIGLTNTAGTCEVEGEVHSDAEPWVGMQMEIRQAMIAKYDAQGFRHDNAVLRQRCAEGALTADRCSGERRWAQLIHDGMILQPPSPTYLDARDAIAAADLARSTDTSQNWPSNAAELWSAFARRGWGDTATTTGADDVDPVASFHSPLGGNIPVHFDLRDETGAAVKAQIFVGQYESRTTPSGDTDPFTAALSDTLSMQPGSYDFVVRADGFGHARLHLDLATGSGAKYVSLRLARNFASGNGAHPATITGMGARLDKVIDEREATNWEWLKDLAAPNVDTGETIDAVKPNFTIALADGTHDITRVQVSGMIQVVVGEVAQGRFSSIHQFALAACDQTSKDCTKDSNFNIVYTSPADAFPSAPFRPVVRDMLLREFRLPAPVRASHLRFIALHNKCSGTEGYWGYFGMKDVADNDPLNNTDCRKTNGRLTRKNASVRVAEVEVFGSDAQESNDRIFANGFE